MQDLTWSFIDTIATDARGRLFHLTFNPETLQRIGYPEDTKTVPEGLLIEGCAQASGISLFLTHPEFSYLPVLAKVNRASFHAAALTGEPLRAQTVLTHQSEAGALFECVLGGEDLEKPYLECEILLGFVPFEELPDLGKEARKRLRNFIERLHQ